MRLKILWCLLAFLPLLIHAQDDEEYIINEWPTESRPTVACAYGNPGETRYAATWINDGAMGQPWQMGWGMSLKAFDEWVSKWRMQGYRLVIISANGPAGKAAFHGVMAFPSDRLKWAYKCEIKDLDKYMAGKDNNGISRVNSFRMATSDGHWNTPSQARCQMRAGYLNSTTHMYRDNSYGLTNSLFPTGVITPLMTDVSIGGWSAAVRLDQEQMAEEIRRQGHQWFMPIDIQGASGLGKTQFTAVFAERMRYQPRLWAAHGKVSGFKNNKEAKKELDIMMKKFMVENGIRQAQISIGARGHAMLERSYTWAETAYGSVKPDDVFLIGGVSKMFLYAAVKWCVDQLLVEYDTPVYKLLGYRNPFDERAEDITIQHLLDHTAGYDRDDSGEAAFEFGKVGLTLPHNGTEPATLHDVIKYKLKQRLDYNPGERFVHSHYGSLLLGEVVANLTEMPYVDFLKKHILDGLDVSVFETDSKAHLKDKIVQQGLQIGVDARYPGKGEYVAGIYGGDGAIKEETAAAFSLRASATSLIKFAGQHCKYPSSFSQDKIKLTSLSTAVARVGKRRDGYRRGGIEGGYAYVESHGDFDWAMVFNTREFASKNAVVRLAHKIRKFIDKTVAENKYGPFTLTCNPGPEIFGKSFPGMHGISFDSLGHLPDCTEEELDELMHDRKDG
ncbi:hypothetical protein NXS19_004028 [Fusarium pseudograminearum]|nr:hypothetical protein NXS19_004028 [Fusarium pseudograminearum]